MTIAACFAVFSTSLNINGSATTSSTWNVHISNVAVESKLGSAYNYVDDSTKIEANPIFNNLTANFEYTQA